MEMLLSGTNPHLLYAKASKVFMELRRPKAEPVTSKLAAIHDSANIGDGSNNKCSFVTISEDVVVDHGVSIGPSSFLGKGVKNRIWNHYSFKCIYI